MSKINRNITWLLHLMLKFQVLVVKIRTIWLLKLMLILLQWYVKKDVKKELKLVDNYSEEEEAKAIDFNDTIQYGLLLPLTHKANTQEESESHEVANFATTKSLEHLNVGQKRKFNSPRKHKTKNIPMSEFVFIAKTTCSSTEGFTCSKAKKK